MSDLKQHDVAHVGVALGLRLQRGALSPCPKCGATQRGSSDPRFPVGIRSDQRGWQCHRCKETGDVVNLAAWVIVGSRQVEKHQWHQFASEVARRGLTNTPMAPPKVVIEPPRIREADLMAFWNGCLPVDADPLVGDYLNERKVPIEEVVARDLARVVPATGPLPSWAKYRGDKWNECEQQFRVVVKLFDALGRFVNVHARALHPKDPKGRDKAAAAALGSGSLKGLVMADALGRLMLSNGRLGDDRRAREVVGDVGLVIAEGEPDFLSWATRYSESNEHARAVLGVVAGSWTDEVAACVPSGTHICLTTHHDKDGNKYAKAVWLTLHQRCPFWRRPRKERPHVNEAP